MRVQENSSPEMNRKKNTFSKYFINTEIDTSIESKVAKQAACY